MTSCKSSLADDSDGGITEGRGKEEVFEVLVGSGALTSSLKCTDLLTAVEAFIALVRPLVTPPGPPERLPGFEVDEVDV
jgi:hypothetical protein